MLSPQEVTLSTIPGTDEDSRVAVVLTHADAQSRIELHQQSWGEGIGWFTQNKVVLEPQQAAALAASLDKSKTGVTADYSNLSRSWTPRVVSADSA